MSTHIVAKPFRGLGGFFAMAMDTFGCMIRRPFAWREYLLQTWFVARVSLVPTLMLSIPFTVLTVFTFNVTRMGSQTTYPRRSPIWFRQPGGATP